MQKIILASGSPRRKEILELMGLNFEIVDSGYDEDLVKTNDPIELVEELALQKALKVAQNYPDAVIIGGDTTVTIGDPLASSGQAGWMAKADNKEEARGMFGSLLGKSHSVVTGVAVVNSLTGEQYVGHDIGIVSFRQASKLELDQYVNNEKNWRGFAGAYALQGGAAPFALSQEGKLSAIIGMPVELTVSLLEQAGVIVEIDPVELEHSLHGMKVGIEA